MMVCSSNGSRRFSAFHEMTKSNGVVSVTSEDYEQLVEDIVRDGRLYASENHQEILKVSPASHYYSTLENIDQ